MYIRFGDVSGITISEYIGEKSVQGGANRLLAPRTIYKKIHHQSHLYSPDQHHNDIIFLKSLTTKIKSLAAEKYNFA